MVRALMLLLSFTFLMATESAWAAPYRRLVNFEWEAIEGANS